MRSSLRGPVIVERAGSRQHNDWCVFESTADPELGEGRCPNGHDSSLPPPLPELSFEACRHYRPTAATWNEFCITCGVRHVAFRIYWRGHEGRYGGRVNNPKNYCGYCGAKMVTVRSSR
jgi:hypothetical protein